MSEEQDLQQEELTKKRGKMKFFRIGYEVLITILFILYFVAAGSSSEKSRRLQFEYDSLKQSFDEVSSELSQVQSEYTAYKEEMSQSSEPANNNEAPKEEASVQSTLSQRNALERAKSYLSHSAFSYTSLVSQLEYEGFPTTDATYAVDNCGADWNEQAAKKAESYLSHSSFSRQSLLDQLLYEGFTAEQAEYGVSSVGY